LVASKEVFETGVWDAGAKAAADAMREARIAVFMVDMLYSVFIECGLVVDKRNDYDDKQATTTSKKRQKGQVRRRTSVQYEQTIDDATSRSSKGNKATRQHQEDQVAIDPSPLAFLLSFFAVLVTREDDLELQVRIF
jgi:hypothetical protein